VRSLVQAALYLELITVSSSNGTFPNTHAGNFELGIVCFHVASHLLVTVFTEYRHTRARAFSGHFSGTTAWAGTRKVKPIWILLKQDKVSGSGISWAISKSASRSSQITMPVPHHLSFLRARCPSCRPTNSVKALFKGTEYRLRANSVSTIRG